MSGCKKAVLNDQLISDATKGQQIQMPLNVTMERTGDSPEEVYQLHLTAKLLKKTLKYLKFILKMLAIEHFK